MILVPMRPDRSHRDKLWRFVRQRWVTDFPTWPIFEGLHTQGPFNRSAAINTASAKAGDWDVAVIIDSDSLANKRAVQTMVELALATHRLVISHSERVMLTKAATQRVLQGFTGSWRGPGMEECVWRDSVSSCIAVSRRLWDEVGGFDEVFSDWGHEDSAFEIACETMSGKPYVRLGSELFHLWHPPPAGQRDARLPSRRRNMNRMAAYEKARGDKRAIKALMAQQRTG